MNEAPQSFHQTKKKAYLSRQKTELRERLDCIIMTMAFSISVIFSITHSSFATSWMLMWDLLELKEVQRAATALLKSIQLSVYMQNPHWIHVIKYAATLPPFQMYTAVIVMRTRFVFESTPWNLMYGFPNSSTFIFIVVAAAVACNKTTRVH